MDEKNEPSEKTDKVRETLETCMALKKKIQCKAINKPTKINLRKDFKGIRNDFFLNTRKIARNIPAKNMRYQTKASAFMVINAPKMAVKPQIKTIKWRFK